MSPLGWIVVAIGLVLIIWFVLSDKTCPACHGTGEMFDEDYKNGSSHDCPHCRGRGKLN